MQGSYIPYNTQDLLIRSREILGEIPDITNLESSNDIINSLAGSCYEITIKNTISSISYSIVTCSGSSPTTCGAIPAACPVVDPTTYVNMVVIFTATAAQSTGSTITFQYVLNGTPTTTVLTPGSGSPAIVAGTNTYYAFPTNIQYAPNTNLTLYGVNIQV